ncbi:MAG: Lrp/AsnC family transcriptional regulator [Synergistaceae bacterium]|jgi:Lrp/AsnC family leucine-responsive transcriptional regulator|nr:Lrp/AsnC family transcriptional regulator [Synergistaceae bacterium]
MPNYKVHPIDETGWRILEELQANARISFRELAKKVNLSPTAVVERVKRMESDGVIRGYCADIDARRAGYSFSALLNISANCEQPSLVIFDMVKDIPEVVSSWSITGTVDHVLEVQLPSLDFLEKLLNKLTKIGHVTTHIVLPNVARYPGKRILRAPREDPDAL